MAAWYLNWDGLRYSFRSLNQYAPWTRTVYLVTDEQIPSWLDTCAPGLHAISHREIFSAPSPLSKVDSPSAVTCSWAAPSSSRTSSSPAAAGKNDRALIETDFGSVVSQKRRSR